MILQIRRVGLFSPKPDVLPERYNRYLKKKLLKDNIRKMILSEVILNCKNYIDTDEIIHSIFAKRNNGKFLPNSEALVLELTPEEMEMQLNIIAETKCPEFEYFFRNFCFTRFL